MSTFLAPFPAPVPPLPQRPAHWIPGALAGLVLAGIVPLELVPAAAGPAPPGPAPKPIRWNSGGAVWSTSQRAVDVFLATGVVSDRGLAEGLARSGWPVEEMRAALSKSYSVDLVALSRFLTSPAGEAFLREATGSYLPYGGLERTAVPALRSAILRDGEDGAISAAGIMRALPTSFRLADSGSGRSGAQILCSRGHCQPGTPQCTSLLSWYAFLPACLQARQAAAAAQPQAPAGPR